MAAANPTGWVNPLILTVPPSPSTVSNAQLNVSDDTKRWITVGIALNTVLVPALRLYVDHEINKFYSKLCKSDKIDLPKNSLKSDPGNGIQFNYRSLNKKGNIRGIKDHHELAKLYIEPHMVKFSCITDEAFEASAILNVMERSSCFSKNDVKCARDVRTQVRNNWAHCKMNEWNSAKYYNSFQFMEDLAKVLPLPNAGPVLKKLKEWKNDGIKLIGKNVDQSLITKVMSEADKIVKVIKVYAENFTDEVEKIIANVETLKNNFKELEERQNILEDEQVMMKNVQLKHSERLSSLEQTSVKTGGPLFDIPNRNQFFIGRKKILSDMEDSLMNKSETSSILTCSGLGGIGKTSMAVELCHKMEAKFPGGIYWLTADSEYGDNIIRSSLFSLARKMNQMDPSFDDDRLVDLITHHLEKQDKSLLVIDNLDAEKFSSLANKLVNGRWFKSSKVSMLITSRLRQDQLRENIDITPSSFTLESFDLAEGVEFLKQRTEMQCEVLDAQDIVLQLGGLPLALEQAAAYIIAIKCPFQKYFERMKREKMKILNRKKAKPPSEEIQQEYKERLAVNTTWSMNMKCIRNECPAADEFMPVLAFLSPRYIPREIFNQGAPRLENEELASNLEDDFDVSEIIHVLSKLSLFDHKSEENVTVHRMVQDIIKETVITEDTEKEGFLGQTFQNITRVLTYAIRNGESPSKYLSCMTQKQWETSPLIKWAQLVENLGHFLDEIKKLNRFSMAEFKTLEFLELLDHATLYYFTINQTNRSSFYKKLKVDLMSNMDLSSEDVIPNEFSLSLSNTQKEYLYQLIDPAICNEKKWLSSEDTQMKIKNLNDEGDLQLVGMNWPQASLSYIKCLELETSKECRQTIFLKLCRAFYEQGQFEQATNTALQILREDPHCSSAYLWLAIHCQKKEQTNPSQADEGQRFSQHSNAVKEMTSVIYGELGFAYAALALHFSNNDLQQRKLLTKHGYHLHRTKVVKVHTEEQLENAIQKSSLERQKGGFNIILIKSGVYKISPKSLQDSYLNLIFGESLCDPPTLLLEDLPCHIFFRNIFANLSFKLQKYNLNISHKDHSDTTMFFNCQFEANCTINKPKLSKENLVRLIEERSLLKNNMTPEEAEMKTRTPEEKVKDHLITDTKDMLPASPAIAVQRGKCGLINCKINSSLGAGALVTGVSILQNNNHQTNPFLYAQGCTIRNCIAAGLETREGGSLLATNCNIMNSSQGVLIWKDAAKVDISNCKISENNNEGILAAAEGFHFTELTEVKLYGNDVHHNNLGISTSFLRCIDIQENAVFANNWGIFIRNPWTVIVEGNDIKRNYVGGIRCCLNRFDNTLIRNNKIHDHTGPNIIQTTLFSEQDELLYGSSGLNRKLNSCPVLTQDNISYNNELSYAKVADLIVTSDYICHYCHRNGAKMFCDKCGRVRYCNGNCQEQDTAGHQTFCKYFQENHTVEIKLQYFQFDSHPGLENRRCEKSKKSLMKSEFLVKIQAGSEGMGMWDNERRHKDIKIFLYDESRTISGIAFNQKLFELVRQFGKLGTSKMYSKKIFLYAKILKGDKNHIQVRTDELIHDQDW